MPVAKRMTEAQLWRELAERDGRNMVLTDLIEYAPLVVPSPRHLRSACSRYWDHADRRQMDLPIVVTGRAARHARVILCLWLALEAEEDARA